MFVEKKPLSWKPFLPPVKGRYTFNKPLGPLTWFRTGGNAEIFFEPSCEQDLIHFFANKPADLPVSFLGNGSNTLVRDGGVPGATIHLGKTFFYYHAAPFRPLKAHSLGVDSPEIDSLEVGAGTLCATLTQICIQRGLGGLEFLCGIPGSVGGVLRMNAGAYGTEISDKLLWASAIHVKGGQKVFSRKELSFRYRSCGIEKGWIFTKACFKVIPTPPHVLEKRVKDLLQARHEAQPVKEKTGGSTFKNPAGHTAWKLIFDARCQGLVEGGASVSTKHCNFLINHGHASSFHIETLGEKVRRKVLKKTGVLLEWEIKRLGVFQKT